MTAPGLLLAGVVTLSACAGRAAPPPAAGDSAAVDSLRGRLEVVGSEPATQIALMLPDGRHVTLVGPRPALDRTSGLEVVVWGASTEPRTFQVERFAVRAANGVAAVDGTLILEEGRNLLLTGDGRRLPLPNLPAALAGRSGARIWLAGPLDRAPDSFGTIALP